MGFFAQGIDGAIGMAYGVSSTLFLLSIGVPPAAAAASPRIAEVATTGIAGVSHWRQGNIDWKLVPRLLIPGVAGGIVGAYFLTSIEGDLIRPYISVYLLILGIVILVRSIAQNKRKSAKEYFGALLKTLVQNAQNEEVKEPTALVGFLGLSGGFLDAIGGGGWGPVVTTTLVARGNSPRKTIGSVIFSEFFVAFAETITFALTLEFMQYWQVILGLLIGGAIAAPLGAKVTKVLPPKILMILVGVLIIILSIYNLYDAFA